MSSGPATIALRELNGSVRVSIIDQATESVIVWMDLDPARAHEIGRQLQELAHAAGR